MQDFVFSAEEVKALVNGKFQSRKCTECDGLGVIYDDGNGNKITKAMSVDNYNEPCDDCRGLGFNILFNEEE